MDTAAYARWALLPLDKKPEATSPTTYHPAMMSVVTLDRDTSLVFEIRSPPATGITVEATQLSAENRGPDLFRVFTGSSDDAYHEVSVNGWQASHEGMHMAFSTAASGLGRYAKLVFTGARPLVVTRVSFSQP